MSKEFNNNGICHPNLHFMVDTTDKTKKILTMIKKGKYFMINRPRQYGKSTIAMSLEKMFENSDDYLFIKISFEYITQQEFATQELMCTNILKLIKRKLNRSGQKDLASFVSGYSNSIKDLSDFSDFVTDFVRHCQKKVVFLIDDMDEVGFLFEKLLALLRQKYNEERGNTFHSIILLSVHSLSHLHRKQGKSKTVKTWNISSDFNINMSFDMQEIETMLVQYHKETGINMDTHVIADKIHYYTDGYPFLVSTMCKVIDEEFVVHRDKAVSKNRQWTVRDVDASFDYITEGTYMTTLFDSIAQYIDTHSDLNELMYQIVYNGVRYPYALTNNMISAAHMYGLIRNEKGYCMVKNRIFEKKIYLRYIVDNIKRVSKDSSS